MTGCPVLTIIMFMFSIVTIFTKAIFKEEEVEEQSLRQPRV